MPTKALTFGCLGIAALSFLPLSADAADRFNLPNGPGRELVYGYCQTCHDLQSVSDSAGIRKGAWDAVLDNMKGFGLRINDTQRERILEYLGTYLGPNPPPPAPETPADSSLSADGAAVFLDTCAACHQEDASGKEGEFPPLAGNPDIFLSREFPAYVVIHGLEGKITVKGKEIDNVMPPFDFLSDEEIAAALAYVRSQWGNDLLRPSGMADIDAAGVAEVRGKEMTSEEVGKMRAGLLK